MSIIHLEDGVPTSKSKYLVIDMSITDNINAGSYKLSTAKPPRGYIWEVVNMHLRAPNVGGSSSGTQELLVQQGDFYAGAFNILFGSAAYTDDLTFEHMEWTAASSKPSDPANAIMALQSIIATYDTAINVVCNNKTDITQTATIIAKFTVKQTPMI